MTTVRRDKITIIGAGLSGLSSAALLARKGYNVTVIDNHRLPGGVARKMETKGFTFDMGPTWYLMPEVFEDYFNLFKENIHDYIQLFDLDPSYKIFFSPEETHTVTRNIEDNRHLFENLERGGGEKLDRYLEQSAYKYRVALDEFLYREYRSLSDFFNRRMLLEGTRLHVFQKLDNYVKRFFKNPLARKILEYNIVFLGCSPYKSPALYSLMSHVDMTQGVRYPRGGIYSLVDALYRLAREQGATFKFGETVKRIDIQNNRARGVFTDKGFYPCDGVLSTADYHHTETELLEEQYRNYRTSWWNKKDLAPSALLMYLGVKKKLPHLEHHNLFLSENWDNHFRDIFDTPRWPHSPSYYVGCPSKTDATVAPKGNENLFILVPVAPGIDDPDEVRIPFAEKILLHLEGLIGTSFTDDLAVREIISQRDFTASNNLYRGTALGMAHTLFQTACFRPGHRNRHVSNLYYSSHYTHPGIGMPMVLISSQIVADIIEKEVK